MQARPGSTTNVPATSPRTLFGCRGPALNNVGPATYSRPTWRRAPPPCSPRGSGSTRSVLSINYCSASPIALASLPLWPRTPGASAVTGSARPLQGVAPARHSSSLLLRTVARCGSTARAAPTCVSAVSHAPSCQTAQAGHPAQGGPQHNSPAPGRVTSLKPLHAWPANNRSRHAGSRWALPHRPATKALRP